MNINDIPLRELKKAKTKIALYEAGLSFTQDRMFKDVLLDDICRMAGISRVTFFKFFGKKEDLLIYYMRVWLTHRIIEIEERQLRGFEAMRLILRQIADDTSENEGIMPSLIAFLSEMNMHCCMPKLSEAEVMLLFPGQEDIGAESPDMFALFSRIMNEAQGDGTLKPEIQTEAAVPFLISTFYGSFLTSRLYGSKDVMSFYENHLKLIEK
ncbi:TetR/AcrR family transcriptional regulator [Paenibacillus sp. KQZ6P-2]|uniref:TetR/AcrR family transcriptional regulator n=1 Tax=Paenibacillus mangrovi TaxID=2931978 RepID=A0A9X1WR23_9BACL|nr:TetR/AcrR family transcriptional regulator [Paenibacillus mangrovi]MCJ8013101.1 TetR/AcrR family transcriptional regulator [Paenibacillus mangrovi]